jgi:hypothetical protein
LFKHRWPGDLHGNVSTFISGHVDGKPVYSKIRVAPKAVVDEIESRTAKEEMAKAAITVTQRTRMVKDE